MWDKIVDALEEVDSVMYYPILMIVMIIAGIYFTTLTRGVQVRKFRESCRLLMEPTEDRKNVSSFQALMVSTASRVGTGNIVGVSTAICLGGPGACFWMWIMCIIGAASAFTESTLAQIYKRRDAEGGKLRRTGLLHPACTARPLAGCGFLHFSDRNLCVRI